MLKLTFIEIIVKNVYIYILWLHCIFFKSLSYSYKMCAIDYYYVILSYITKLIKTKNI